MSAATTTVEITPDALALATRELEPAEALVLRADIADFLGRVTILRERAKGIRVTARGQESEEKMARVTRLACRSERVEALAQLKAMKASSLRRGRAIDGVAAVIREMLEPVEEYLLEQEKFTERADAAERSAVSEARSETLRALGADPTLFIDLGALSDEAWAVELDRSRLANEAKLEAAKQAEAVRMEVARLEAEARATAKAAAVKIEAARIERERVQAEENARLRQEKAEADEAHRIEREKAADEARAAKAEAQAAQIAAQTKAHEAAKAAAEETRKARAEADRIAAELTALQVAHARAEREAAETDVARIEAELAAAKAAEADAKPTKAKYAALVGVLNTIAAWDDDIGSCDEPRSASRAREVLIAVGLGRKAGA